MPWRTVYNHSAGWSGLTPIIAILIHFWFVKTRNVQKPNFCSYLLTRYVRKYDSLKLLAENFERCLKQLWNLWIFNIQKRKMSVKTSHTLPVPNLVDGLHPKVTRRHVLWCNHIVRLKDGSGADMIAVCTISFVQEIWWWSHDGNDMSCTLRRHIDMVVFELQNRLSNWFCFCNLIWLHLHPCSSCLTLPQSLL